MIVKHPKISVAVSTWDWKEQPPWGEIQDMMEQISNETGRKVKIVEIQDTGCDENAIVICDYSVGENEANAYYKQHLEWEEGIDPDSLDWESAKGLLKVRLDTVWDSPKINLQRRQCFSLLDRFAAGERSSDLFDEIQAMTKGHVSSKFLN